MEIWKRGRRSGSEGRDGLKMWGQGEKDGGLARWLIEDCSVAIPE